MTKDCRDCRHCGMDMDLDPFCTHPNANPMGTVLRVMRGPIKTENMRGEPCGNHALFFIPRKEVPNAVS